MSSSNQGTNSGVDYAKLKKLKSDHRISFEAVAAVSSNGAIGKDGDLPWRLPTDLKLFKAHTMGGILLMGRKTYESLPGPLTGRLTLVLTHDKSWKPECEAETEVIHSLEEIFVGINAGRKIFVCGGAEIYKLTEPLLDTMRITYVDKYVEAPDVYFPLDIDSWSAKPSTELKFEIVNYVRRELPEVGSEWVHRNGNKYTVTAIANSDSVRLDEYPITIVYMGDNGKTWSRKLDDWHRSMTAVQGKN